MSTLRELLHEFDDIEVDFSERLPDDFYERPVDPEEKSFDDEDDGANEDR